MTAGACHAYSGLVTNDLGGDHRDRLALCGVNFAGHDAAAWLVFREIQLAEPAARTGAKETDIVSNLHQGAGNDVESTVSLNKSIMASKGFKLPRCQSITPVIGEVTCLVRCSLEFQTGYL